MLRLLSAHSTVWPVNVAAGSPGAVMVYPMIGVRVLLKLWTIPLAMVPRA